MKPMEFLGTDWLETAVFERALESEVAQVLELGGRQSADAAAQGCAVPVLDFPRDKQRTTALRRGRV